MAEKKALFLYSDATGRGQVNKRLDYVLSSLRKSYPGLEVKKTSSMEEGMELAKKSCGVYDALIFSGGDGTFHHMINALAGCENVPTIGYLNGGTIGDIGINFGIHRNLKKALRIIEEGHTTGFDLGKIGDRYFAYVAAIGAFADIPYVTKRAYKKRLGRIAYYFKAVGDAFKPKAIPVHIEADGKTYDMKVPFLLCLNGKNVGGFRVNSTASRIHDGKFELYLTKPGIFNGLLHYLFFKARTTKIVAAKMDIKVDYPLPWDLDGEAAMEGSITIEAVDSKMRIFCAKKYAEYPR